MFCGTDVSGERTERDDGQKRDGNGRRKIWLSYGCSTVIIFRRIVIDYIYSANRARSQIPRRKDLLTKSTPRKADKLSIKMERHASTPMPS